MDIADKYENKNEQLCRLVSILGGRGGKTGGGKLNLRRGPRPKRNRRRLRLKKNPSENLGLVYEFGPIQGGLDLSKDNLIQDQGTCCSSS